MFFFIDASKEFEKGKNQNNMTEDHIAKILETYQKRENVEKFAHLVSFEEIVENDYNLNIPRYVDTFEEEPVVPLADLADQLAEIDKEIGEVETRLAQMRSQLSRHNTRSPSRINRLSWKVERDLETCENTLLKI